MSARSELQQRLAAWLGTWTTASYGVVTSLRKREVGPGKARVIVFGLSRDLNATLTIWSPTRLELVTSRAEQIRFTSEDQFVQHCIAQYNAPARKGTTR